MISTSCHCICVSHPINNPIYLPTPVGPKKAKVAIGFEGSDIPALQKGETGMADKLAVQVIICCSTFNCSISCKRAGGDDLYYISLLDQWVKTECTVVVLVHLISFPPTLGQNLDFVGLFEHQQLTALEFLELPVI